jgi:Predicted transcriptional regulators
MELNKRLKELRKIHKITQVQAALGSEMTERAYQRLEAGHSPSYEALIALADYFDVSLDYLVGRSDVPERR